MKNIHVEVTQRDIDTAHKENISRNCPIARAIQRVFTSRDVTVGLEIVRVEQGSDIRTYRLPAEAIRFRDRYDHDKAVKPLMFTMSMA